MVLADASEINLAASELLGALPEPAILLSTDRLVVGHNNAAMELVRPDAFGTDLARSIRNPTLIETVDLVMSDNVPRTCEIALNQPEKRTYEVAVGAIRGENMRFYLLSFKDLTQARQAEAIHATFVANVSHELRSPLTTLMGGIEALQGPASQDPRGRDRLLGLMAEEAHRMRSLVQDLLSLSRLEALQFIRPSNKVDLKPILDDAKRRLGERAESRNMHLKIQVPEDLPDITGKEDELLQVFDNLIDNAIKYGDSGSEVTVSAGTTDQLGATLGPLVKVSVHNFGTHIPSEHIPRLTERFYRVDKSRSRELGGTGLGLAIVKYIVTRHKGRLSVDSDPESGTTFSVLFPVLQ